jgi:hypothetical protein
MTALSPRGNGAEWTRNALCAGMNGFLLLLLALLMTAPLAAASTEPPVRVTTDSSTYCAELASRFAAQPATYDETTRLLAEEGQRLCDTGFVRTGIAKLRRALRAAAHTGG